MVVRFIVTQGLRVWETANGLKILTLIWHGYFGTTCGGNQPHCRGSNGGSPLARWLRRLWRVTPKCINTHWLTRQAPCRSAAFGEIQKKTIHNLKYKVRHSFYNYCNIKLRLYIEPTMISLVGASSSCTPTGRAYLKKLYSSYKFILLYSQNYKNVCKMWAQCVPTCYISIRCATTRE